MTRRQAVLRITGLAALAAALLAAGVTLIGMIYASAANAATPVCQRVEIQENSGQGPNFPLKVCNGALAPLPLGHHWVFVIDGSKLPEKSTKHVTIVIAEVAQTILPWPGAKERS